MTGGTERPLSHEDAGIPLLAATAVEAALVVVLVETSVVVVGV